MKITFNQVELAGLGTKIREWEKETGEKASIQFVMTMLSAKLSEELDEHLKQIFDKKRKLLEDAKRKERE